MTQAILMAEAEGPESKMNVCTGAKSLIFCVKLNVLEPCNKQRHTNPSLGRAIVLPKIWLPEVRRMFR